MSALSRRGILAGLGLAVAPVAVSGPATRVGSADARLEACAARLWEVEAEIERLPVAYTDEAVEALLKRMDAILTEAAFTKPETARGWGVKARIAQVYSEDSNAGASVQRALLADLIERGGVTA